MSTIAFHATLFRGILDCNPMMDLTKILARLDKFCASGMKDFEALEPDDPEILGSHRLKVIFQSKKKRPAVATSLIYGFDSIVRFLLDGNHVSNKEAVVVWDVLVRQCTDRSFKYAIETFLAKFPVFQITTKELELLLRNPSEREKFILYAIEQVPYSQEIDTLFQNMPPLRHAQAMRAKYPQLEKVDPHQIICNLRVLEDGSVPDTPGNKLVEWICKSGQFDLTSALQNRSIRPFILKMRPDLDTGTCSIQ